MMHHHQLSDGADGRALLEHPRVPELEVFFSSFVTGG
jgi:hypothetical protein